MRITTIDVLKLLCGEIKDKSEVLVKIENINEYLSDVLEIFEEYFGTTELDKIQEALEYSNIPLPDVDEEEGE